MWLTVKNCFIVLNQIIKKKIQSKFCPHIFSYQHFKIKNSYTGHITQMLLILIIWLLKPELIFCLTFTNHAHRVKIYK